MNPVRRSSAAWPFGSRSRRAFVREGATLAAILAVPIGAALVTAKPIPNPLSREERMLLMQGSEPDEVSLIRREAIAERWRTANRLARQQAKACKIPKRTKRARATDCPPDAKLRASNT